MNTYIVIDNYTTPVHFEKQLVNIYGRKEFIILNIDASKCSIVNLSKISSLKPILDKYRSYTKKYVHYTNVYVHNIGVRILLNTILPFIRTEHPVYIHS